MSAKFSDSGAQVNPPSAVSIIISALKIISHICNCNNYHCRCICLSCKTHHIEKKTSYDYAKLDSKKNRDYEKYHSEWSEEEVFGSRKTSTDAKEFREMYNENSLPNYYLILELTNDSSESEIKSQYRKLAKQYHPDRNKDSSEKNGSNQ